nr:MAG TPA: hypothetical protein [Caudoviricetes sp.]
MILQKQILIIFQLVILLSLYKHIKGLTLTENII